MQEYFNENNNQDQDDDVSWLELDLALVVFKVSNQTTHRGGHADSSVSRHASENFLLVYIVLHRKEKSVESA